MLQYHHLEIMTGVGKEWERFEKRKVVKESSLRIRERIYQAHIEGLSDSVEYPFEICGYKFEMNLVIEVFSVFFFASNVLMLHVVACI